MSNIQTYIDMYNNDKDKLVENIFDYIDTTYSSNNGVNIGYFNVGKYTMQLNIKVNQRQVYSLVYLYNTIRNTKHHIYVSLDHSIYGSLMCMKKGNVMLSSSIHLFPDDYLTNEMCEEICDKHLEEFPDEDNSPMLYTDSSIMKLFSTKIIEHDLAKCYEDFMMRMHKEYTESVEDDDVMVKPACIL